jgi:hypothetical protein
LRSWSRSSRRGGSRSYDQLFLYRTIHSIRPSERFATATRTEYVRYLRRLADHFRCDPATLCETQVREHLLHLREAKHNASSSLHLVRYAYRSFFVECIKTGVGWRVFSDFKIRRPRPIPRILRAAHNAAKAASESRL